MIRRTPSPRRASAAALLGLALAAGALGASAPAARADGGSADALLDEANRKVRQRDVPGALRSLEQAIALAPGHVDAHVRYQDVAREVEGLAALQTRYGAAAKARPDDDVAQFLSTRLLPPDQAIAAFDKLGSRFPDSPWPRAGRARALEELGRHAEAAVAHGEAISRAGDRVVRFLAYQAYGHERAAQWGPAADAWRQVVAKDPRDLSARFGLAEALRRNGLLDEALAALDDAAKLGATEPEVHYRRGLVHMDAGRHEKALESFDAALQTDRAMLEALCAATDAAIRVGFAKAEAEKREVTEKDLERAVSYGDRAVIAWPDAASAHFALGAAHEASAQANAEAHLDAAFKAYDAAVQRTPLPGPDKVRALTAKAFLQIQREDWAGALEAAQRAIDIDPACVIAYGHAGYALTAQQKPQEAAEKYRAGLKVAPKEPRLLHELGIALWQAKKPNDARKPLEEARTLAPKKGRYRLTLGELYYELRRYREATEELAQATDLLPREIGAWRSYARACYSSKAYDECARAFEKVVELDPQAVDEHLYLAIVYSDELKDKEKARKAALKFKEKGGSDPNLDAWLTQIIEGDEKK